jgi:hypothetical protein
MGKVTKRENKPVYGFLYNDPGFIPSFPGDPDDHYRLYNKYYIFYPGK